MRLFLIICAMAAICLSSCERTDCEYYNKYKSSDYTARLSETYDTFHTDVLYGMWQMQNGCIIGNREILELWFYMDGKVDLVIENKYDPTSYTVTGVWRRYGRSIDIATNDIKMSLWVEKYTWPCLYVQCGSPQTFEMIKRKGDY